MNRTTRARSLVVVCTLVFAGVSLAPTPAYAAGGAVIDNGVIKLGINSEGDLNFDGFGVTFMATGNDGTRAGCECEGWGAAATDAAGTIYSGSADRSSGSYDTTLESFTSTASTAESVTNIDGVLRVRQQFAPAPETPHLYRIAVTLENMTSGPLSDVRYSRTMDWDVEPTAFSEFVTIQRGSTPAPAGNLLYSDDNGFSNPDPYASRGEIAAGTTNSDFTDSGPRDHGAMFDFGFGSLAAGKTKSFNVYYGATGTESAANAVISAAGAEMYSYGQPNGGASTGQPNTFIFAFRAVGGAPIIPPTLTVAPRTGTGAVGSTHTLTATLKDSSNAPIPGAPIVFARTGANPGSTAASTNGSGVATTSYVGANPGSDNITACYDTSGDGACQSDEVTDTATFTWTSATPAGSCNGRPATMVGTSGNDTITGTAGDDVILGLGGNDTIRGMGGNDTVCAGAGVDFVDLGPGAEQFADGGADNDQVVGGPGNDTLRGSAGFDRLNGMGGVNTLDGGADRDRCDGRAGDTKISCEE